MPLPTQQERPNGGLPKTNGLRVFALLVAVIVIGAYKLLWPWAPFWVDLVVIALGLVLYISSSRSRRTNGDPH